MLGMYEHSGTAELSYDIKLGEKGDLHGGSFTVDMNTILATDENFNPEEGKTKEKLEGHLKSADFFDTENHPTASFEIVSVDGENQTMVGNMTIKGNTNKETVEYRINSDGTAMKAKLTVDRAKYGLTWQHPVKENVLSDEIKIEIVVKI